MAKTTGKTTGKTSTTKVPGIAAIKAGNSDVSTDAAMKLFDKLMAEKKPAVPQGFAEELERSITGAGADAVNRRMATAFLSRPFKMIAKKIRDDSDTAQAFAAAAARIRESVQKYRGLADLMESAEVRIQMALCQREDMQEILAMVEADPDRTLQ